MDKRAIEIDLEVHRFLESERRSFSESTNDILRRLLGMEPAAFDDRASTCEPLQTDDWVWNRAGQRASLPAGTHVRARYAGQEFAGVIAKGAWLVDGQRFETPSEAIINLARTKEGRKTNLNGWQLWEFRRPAETSWKRLNILRG